jgi:hypothetical protein
MKHLAFFHLRGDAEKKIAAGTLQVVALNMQRFQKSLERLEPNSIGSTITAHSTKSTSLVILILLFTMCTAGTLCHLQNQNGPNGPND